MYALSVLQILLSCRTMYIYILLLFLTLIITPIMNWAQDVYKIIYTDKFQTLQSISAASEVRVGKVLD